MAELGLELIFRNPVDYISQKQEDTPPVVSAKRADPGLDNATEPQ